MFPALRRRWAVIPCLSSLAAPVRGSWKGTGSARCPMVSCTCKLMHLPAILHSGARTSCTSRLFWCFQTSNPPRSPFYLKRAICTHCCLCRDVPKEHPALRNLSLSVSSFYPQIIIKASNKKSTCQNCPFLALLQLSAVLSATSCRRP